MRMGIDASIRCIPFRFGSLSLSTSHASLFLHAAFVPTRQSKLPLCNKRANLRIDKHFRSFYCRILKQYINAQEASKILNVHRSTVIRWIKDGKLPGSIRLPGTKAWRIPLSSYERFVKTYYESH